MIPLISIIIPSYNRSELLSCSIDKLILNFNLLNFKNYEIIAINSSDNIPFIKDIEHVSENIKIYNFNKQIFPGISRNFGVSNSNSEWIWFIDDDDEIEFEHLNKVIEFINIETVDLIAHSLKFIYSDEDLNSDLLKKILLFKEKQEVFNYIFRRSIIINNNIKFSDGLHEDIRYVVDLILHSENKKILNHKIYNKILRFDSITNHFNTKRIDGYINAISEILQINNSIILDLSNEITVQCFGTILYLINKSDNNLKILLLKYLDKITSSEIKYKFYNIYNARNSNFKFAFSIFLSDATFYEKIEKLHYCFNTHLSCKDLKESIFFGPEEIIGCCKRFFFDNKMKGDIILLKNNSAINLKSIIDRKREVENLINSENFNECEGCPYLKRFEKKEKDNINYISIENFTYCNMRCTYCSPKYYGGKDPLYDTNVILSELLESDYLSNDVHIVWGGGEPTLKPKFDLINEKLLSNDKISKIRVLTNSLKYSESLKNLSKNSKIRIVTSIDAGSNKKFKEIRGKGEILSVFQNLSTYNNSIFSPENLTIKYIITNDNFDSDELDEFIRLLKLYKFHNNFIQISCNFKFNIPNEKIIFSIYELAAKLLTNGFNYIYLDDLIRDRLEITEDIGTRLIGYLKENNLFHKNILTNESQVKIILWGNGFQSDWIKNKTLFGKCGNVHSVISNESELDKIDLLNENIMISPAAIQSLPEIYKELKRLNMLEKTIFAIFI
jgi:glycosyltransferase involved in cell wall biosynthesis/organic radical activating enzyme